MTEQLGEHRRLRSDAPPAPSEDIHLPAPTYLPIIVAAGIAVALVGILLNVILFAFGMVVWIVAVLIWLRRTREEIAELPLDTG